ncbi:V-type ATPase 116kDa subunit family-domain-containing protein [Jimgerdemannia flammicorona]|uniref:V-type ATPase 116kDa subunit family-domain-containing protein n=2 Tax=Jimgerdemannia flammicorona TaxID=994334 RepID=A0A433DCE9_9FUNG|nr:V-type ATPase 116kDa subunit family-domain-containing protein [Jimgerdemannia flammicorona]RUS25094.1 V-type ATPase 116kDa subunit family-domain-containing protein [Jimgerdemannia flammicorona]
MTFGGRYIILLMAIFSIYTGMIYNDVFSRSMNLFETGFNWPENWTLGQLIEAKPNGHVYAFGIDPTWHGADNSLMFSNSYKMKQAIVFGVAHVCILSVSFLMLITLTEYPLSSKPDACQSLHYF